MRKTYGSDYPRTLSALLAWSPRDTSAPAVTDATGTLSRRAFQDRVLSATAGLRNADVGAGARVALWLPNSIDYLAAIFACARLGALAVHINTRFRAGEVGNLLRRSRAIALVTEWGFAPVDFPAIFAGLPGEDRATLGACSGGTFLAMSQSLAVCRCCRSLAPPPMPGRTKQPARRPA